MAAAMTVARFTRWHVGKRCMHDGAAHADSPDLRARTLQAARLAIEVCVDAQTGKVLEVRRGPPPRLNAPNEHRRGGSALAGAAFLDELVFCLRWHGRVSPPLARSCGP